MVLRVTAGYVLQNNQQISKREKNNNFSYSGSTKIKKLTIFAALKNADVS